jgi:hypothetical protein
MPGRIILPLLAVLVLAVSVQPRAVLARGAPLKGQQIADSGWKMGQTGDCVCDEQWYTLGLRPGRLIVNADPLTITMKFQPTYKLMVWLYQGNTLLGYAERTCKSSQRVCNKTFALTSQITRTGVYYLEVKGLNAEGLSYALQVRGNFYRLHCARTC